MTSPHALLLDEVADSGCRSDPRAILWCWKLWLSGSGDLQLTEAVNRK